jgi:Zn-finger nucleic acid-binding protein/DNA-directed RNA polymerase subunit RPC12/RpoP
MRLLVACPKCKRQYDASTLKVGQRFRCHCGAALSVHEPQGHDAAVVCCAHCGAPRADGALKCAYCGADFTLHERDLDTVCPHCFTRVSNKARFCHFCGTAIHPESMAGESSNLICPACGPEHTLTSRAWSDISVMECNRCTGVWLSNESFQHLMDQTSTESFNSEARENSRLPREPQVEAGPPDGGKRYRPCAVCRKLMVKRNFAQSGVIIDICRYHGMWFDADELPRILDWIHAGGTRRVIEIETAKLNQPDAIEIRTAVGDAAEILNRPQNPTSLGSFLMEGVRKTAGHWFKL